MSWAAGALPQRPGERLDVLGRRLAPGDLAADQVVNETSGPNARVKSGSRLRPDHGGVDLLDVVAERLEQRRGVARRPARTPDRPWRPRAADVSVSPIRSRPGRPPAARRSRPPAGGGAQVASPSSGPASTSSTARRVLAPSASARRRRPGSSGRRPGPTDTRPRAGLSPTSPQHAAGIRIEPPPSLPCATGTIPAATAAADAAARPARGPTECPTGCGSGRTGAARSSAGSPSRASRSCPRSRTRPRAAGARGTRRGPATKSPNRSLPIVSGMPVDRPVVLDRDRHAGERARIARADRIRRGRAPTRGRRG